MPEAAGSPEIARRQGEGILEGPEAVSLDAGHAVVLLQPAFHDQQRAAQHGAAVPFEGGRIDDDVGDSRLVLEGEEDEPLRGAGTLAHHHGAGDAHTPAGAHLREIVILRPESAALVDAARQRANDIAKRAKTEDFAKLASELSESGTKSKGGDLGEVARGELLPDLDKAVFNSPAGTVLGPLESKSAWHILKVESRLPSEVPAFESVKDKLRKDASDDAWQRDYKAYIDRLRKDAFIQIHEENVPTL